jgi:hypothetical protein
MRALSSIPFCPYDGRQAGLLYLPAGWRDTTLCAVAARSFRRSSSAVVNQRVTAFRPSPPKVLIVLDSLGQNFRC